MATQTKVKVAKEVFAEDVGNIAMLEHVNTQVDDQSIATLFYLVGMGFTRDPHMMVGLENMWINLGEQQFHLPTNTPQVLRGHVGIVTPNLDTLADRLEGGAGQATRHEVRVVAQEGPHRRHVAVGQPVPLLRAVP